MDHLSRMMEILAIHSGFQNHDRLADRTKKLIELANKPNDIVLARAMTSLLINDHSEISSCQYLE